MTNSEITLSIDLGTTGIKAAAFDERLNCLCSAVVENRLHYPAPGWVEQDPAHFLASALELTRQIAARLGDGARHVVTITCSGQMGGILGIDADWNAVGHFDAILDPRSNVCRALVAPHAEAIQKIGGGLTTQLEKMLYWRAYQPEAYARIRKFLGLNGFLAGKLAGLKTEDAFTDVTFSMVSGLMNAVTGAWDAGLLEIFEIPRDKLPRVTEPQAVIGLLEPALASQLGLPRGVAILAGAGDGAATFAGAGVSRPGLALDLSGTACALGAYSEEFLPDVQQQLFLNLKSPTAPGWYLIYTNQFGRTHRWFVDTFCQDLMRDGDAGAAYAAMDQQAAALPPGAGGLFAVPHLSGRASPPRPYLRGAWLGFGLGFTRAHFYRSLLESHAAEFRLVKSRLAGLSAAPEPRQVVVAGGGARSDFWNQLKADVLGSIYQRLAQADTSTLRGDAMIAARARGWPALLDGGATARPQLDREYLPDPENTRRYRQIIEDYEALGEGLDPVMMRLRAGRNERRRRRC
jgi:xylulokinase